VILSFKSITSGLRGNDFVRNTAVLTLGAVIAQGINIFAMPILSRLYTPAEFGLLAIFIAVSSIVATSITLRYEAAIILPKDEKESISLMILSGLLVFFGSFLFLVMSFLTPLSVKEMIGVEGLKQWLIAAIFCGMATSFVAIGMVWYNRRKYYLKITILRVIQSGMSVCAALALGFWGVSAGLMIAQIIAFSVIAIYMLSNLWPAYSKGIRFNYIEISNKYSASPKFLLPTSLLDVVTLHMPIFLIAAWFSTESAGQFSMAWKILGLPSALIGSAIAQVFYQRFSTLWPDSDACKNLLIKTWVALAVIGVVPMMVIVFFGEVVFSFVLGDVWSEAGSIASIIAPMLFVMLISSPTSATYLVLGMQKKSLIFGIAVFVYRPACICLGLAYDNLSYGLITLVIVEIMQIILYQFLAFRKIKGNS
jgi:O-antigen/teichoic acid export membrane protein